MNKLLLVASAFLLGLSSCTKDSTSPTQSPEGKDFNISFNVALPGGSDIVYPKSRAEGDPIHDEMEYKIEKIDLYEFFVPEGATPETTTLFEKHSFTKDNGLTSISAGVYTLTLKIPYKYYNEKRKFVFVANDGLDGSSFTSIANGETGTKYSDFLKTLASIKVTDKADASVLAPAAGIAMSGIAKVGESEDIVLKTAFNCDVKLQRIVARIDVVNNTPNMVITGIKLNNAAAQAYIMPQTPFTIPTGTDIEMQYNSKVENSGGTGLGTDFATQNNNKAGLKKAFYLYERTNTEGNHASVEVTYKLNGTKEDKVVVPFKTTKDQKKWVDIERNHLYKIVLGNGKDVISTPVEITLLDEDWNVVDVDHSVDVEQDKMNAALLVNMFTAYNVREVELKGINGGSANKVLSFETEVTNTTTGAPAKHYISFADLTSAGVAGVATPATFTCDATPGVTYRLPTLGEMQLLTPELSVENSDSQTPIYKNPIWGDNEIGWDKVPGTETKKIYKMDENPFIETIYLTNNADGTQNTTATNTEGLEDKVITGTSQLKRNPQISRTIVKENETINISVVYGLRFYGSRQHAAYRWEMCGTDNTDNYFSIKIKALKQYDAITTIDKVANEEFWANDYIELKFPASGRIVSPVNQDVGGLGFIATNSIATKGTTAMEFNEYLIGFSKSAYRFPLRLVKVSK